MEAQREIGERARQAGLTRKTIRFYEGAGVLPPREDIRLTKVQSVPCHTITTCDPAGGRKQRPARPLDSPGARGR